MRFTKSSFSIVAFSISIAVIFMFSGCGMFGNDGGDDGPSISVPDPEDLPSFSGTLPESKSESMSTLTNSMGSFQDLDGTSSRSMSSSKSTTQSESGVADGQYGGTVEYSFKVTYPDQNELDRIESAPYQDTTLKVLMDTNVKVNDIKTADSGGYIINGEEDAYLNMNSEIDFDSSSTQFPSTISYSVTFLYGFALSISPDGSSGTGGKFVLVIEAENSGSIDAESETDVSNNMTIGSFSGSLKVYDNNNELVHDYDLTEQEIYTLSGINPDNFI